MRLAILVKQILFTIFNKYLKALLIYKDIYNNKKQFYYKNLSPYIPI